MRNKLISRVDIERRGKPVSRLRRLWWKITDIDLVPNSIKYFYWGIISYDWRPFRVYYRLKCFFWHRYTTIKPRDLDHTWYDRCGLLPEIMFEILSQFVEKEGVESIVQWYGECPHTVVVNGVEVNAMDEMLALYNWWHLKYKKAYKEIEEDWWAKIANAGYPEDEWNPILNNKGKAYAYEWNQRFKNQQHKEYYNFCMDAINRMETVITEELQEKLIRVVNVRQSMWT